MNQEITCEIELKQKKYLVAFLDFLGASEKMKASKESDDFLQQIYNVYNKSLKALDVKNNNAQIKIEFRIFSDNILLAIELKEQNNFVNMAFMHMQQFCRLFYLFAIQNKLIIRGAIAQGKFFINETFVFGEALIKAHLMEMTIARFPRIIVDRSIFENGNIPQMIKSYRVLKQDPKDNILYLDIFQPQHNVQITPFISEIIMSGYSEALCKNGSILEKYMWLAEEYNEYCANNGRPGEKILIPLNYHDRGYK